MKVCKSIFLATVLCSATSYAQPVSVRAYTDKGSILLGEPLWLTLEVKTLNKTVPPAFTIDSIPHFEFLVKDSAKVLVRGDTTVYHQYYQLTSFDSGRWVIPPFTLRPFVKTNSVLVDVKFTENFDPQQPYHDVQEIRGVAFKMDAAAERWWYLIAGMLIVIVLLVYLLTQPKKIKARTLRASPETAYKKAMQLLVRLKQDKPDEKIFYAQLVEIFRTYILERTGISSLQQTSDNLLEKVRPLMPDEIRYGSLSQVLHLCDFVKFARYHPQDSEATSAFEVVEASVKYIEEELKRPDNKMVQ